MEIINIRQWVLRSKNGDKEAFACLYDAYVKRIYIFIYYKTFHRETAEDLTSHTFIKALENIQRFNSGRSSFSAWLYIIARNLVIDHYRKRRNTIDIQDVWDLAGEQDVELDTQNRILFEKVSGLIQKLPQKHREIVLLRVWEDLPYSEIANILGKSEASCKMMFSRTMAKLKKQVSLTAILFILLFKIII